MSVSDRALASALARAAAEINQPRTLQETLDAIVEVARHSVPGFDHVGISLLHRNGTIETMAATDELVWRIDALQYEHGEGPCLDAVEDQTVVVVEDVRTEQRWPEFIRAAHAVGLRSQMGLQLYADDHTIGGLNLYSTDQTGVPDGTLVIAELFARHAAIALGRTWREHHLSEAIVTRQVIGQAVGIITERYRVNSDRAFQYLARVSQTSNVRVRDVATEIVSAADEQGQATAADGMSLDDRPKGGPSRS